ncbi:MAG: LPS export ABC transporter periplasmic protein LptC [Firmicutes bacterium]|nr:LPS export ABC transporter periplasmic protein LptC [Bacillota bacterium]
MGIGKGRTGTCLAILCGLAGLILFYFSLRPLLTPATEEHREEQGATFLGGRYEGWEGTKQSWCLEAAEIFRPADGRKIIFRGIDQICFFQEDGNNLVLKAAAATLDLKRNSLTLDKVRGEVGGGRLEADKMELDLDKKLVRCDPPLSFTKERLKVQAQRMEGNYQTGEYCFSGDLEVVQKDHRIRGHSFVYQANADRFEIRGGVEVELTL